MKFLSVIDAGDQSEVHIHPNNVTVVFERDGKTVIHSGTGFVETLAPVKTIVEALENLANQK